MNFKHKLNKWWQCTLTCISSIWCYLCISLSFSISVDVLVLWFTVTFVSCFFFQYLKNILFQYMMGKETKVNLLSLQVYNSCVLLNFQWIFYLSFSLFIYPVIFKKWKNWTSSKITSKYMLMYKHGLIATIHLYLCGMTVVWHCVRVSLLFCLQTLSRVIATIVHFSDEQTKRIISYEDAKNSVRTEDMLCTSGTLTVN